MNYYPHHIGDFRSGTINMTRIERWIYRDMMDVYYDTEKQLPLELEKVCDLVGARADDECKIVAYLLRSKFIKTDDGYQHERCELEIYAYRNKADTARNNGKLGGRPKTQPEPKVNQAGNPVKTPGFDQLTGLKTNQEPRTNNQEPETTSKSKASATGSRLPEDWKPSAEDIAYCKTNRPDLRPSLVATNFYDYWIAKPGAAGRKSNWAATWRSWVRKESAATAGRGVGSNVADIEAQRQAANAANSAKAKEMLFGKKSKTDDDEGMVIENA